MDAIFLNLHFDFTTTVKNYMNLLYAIILGLVQGLSEFIPISSTAHLTIAGELMGLIDPAYPERWTAFIAIIQLGTLGAVLYYFKNEIINVSKAFLSENLGKSRKRYSNQSLDAKMGLYVVLGTLPIVTIGLAVKKLIEGDFTKSLTVIAFSLIGLALILFVAERIAKLNRETKDLNWKDALWVGLAQCVALIPGASRSGTTITAGLFLGMNRETAARFSFLLSIPAILASGLLQFYQALEYINLEDIKAIVVATVVAAVSGYFAIDFLIKFLKKNSTKLFIYYRIALGVSILIFINFLK